MSQTLISTERPNVWVTRPAAQAGSLLSAITAAGWTAVPVPTLEIVAPANSDQVAEQARRQLAAAGTAVFVSRNAVDWLWRLLGDNTAHSLTACQVLAVGPGTAAALRSRAISDVVMPDSGADSEALLALPVMQPPGSQNIVIVRGAGGRELLAETLRARGAQVSYIEVYVRRRHPDTGKRLPALWRNQPPAAIVVTSRAGLDALLAMTVQSWRPQLLTTPLICLGRRLNEGAAALGFTDCRPVPVMGGDEAVMKVLQQSMATLE